MKIKQLFAIAVLAAVCLPTRAQIFGTNTGTFVDFLRSYPTDSVPLRYPGQIQQAYNPAPAGTVTGFAPIITGDAGIFSSTANYPSGSGYTLNFTAPNPTAIATSLSGIFSNLTNVQINGTRYSANFTLTHGPGGRLTGGAEIDLTGATAINPISNVSVIQPGGTLNGMTSSYAGYLNTYEAVRWMNNNNINNNSAPISATDLLPGGQNIGSNGNSFDDIITWSNQQTNLKKVWINIPVNAGDSYVKAVADKFAAKLSPGKQVVLEYGNENWNTAFTHPKWILAQAKTDPRVTATDDYTRTSQEAGLLSAHVMQIFQNEFTDKTRVAGFLGSQGAGSYFVDQEKLAINRVFGANAVSSLYKYQGIGFYPADNLASANSVDQVISALNGDLVRQKQYLAADKADATASGLSEAVYEWSPNGYLTQGGVPQAVVDAFRADPRAKQWTLDEWNAISSILGPNDMAMEFSVVGDGWSAQINPLLAHEYEQQAIDQISASLAISGPLAPEPASLSLIGLTGMVLMARRRRAVKAALPEA